MNMRSKLFALALMLLAVPAFAQRVVNQNVSADDKGVAILLRYFPGVSTNSSATVAQVQGTSMTFQVAAAAYAGFECPVSGDLGGIIDLSNAACDTLGEVVDIINATAPSFSTGFFRAVIVDGLRTDSSQTLLAVGTTQVTRTDGYPMYADTSASFAVGETRALIPTSCREDIGCFVTPAGKLLENPYAGQQTVLTDVLGYSTYGSGTSALYVYSAKDSNKASGSESVQTLWGPEAMGASATAKHFTAFNTSPLYGRPNDKVLVRITNSAAQASVVLSVNAYQQNIPH